MSFQLLLTLITLSMDTFNVVGAAGGLFTVLDSHWRQDTSKLMSKAHLETGTRNKHKAACTH